MSIFFDNHREAARRYPLRVAVIGATGSIGKQTLDVCRRHPDKLQVTALAAYDSVADLVAAAREFGVTHVAIGNVARRGDPLLDELPPNCEVRFGAAAVTELASLDDNDCVMNSVVGAVGIDVGYQALVADKTLLYANKESIVVGGDLLMPLAKPGKLIPVDSEHYAIFDCLLGERLAHVTAADALAHPTWNMGPKITVDSATLMNKGLEVLEAKQLFEIDVDHVRVLVHRQSRIHSMVEFVDGTIKAQLGPSDMRIPIQAALSFPERWETPVPREDYCVMQPLTFGEADEDTFRCLALAKEAGRAGGTLPCAMNAANEIANAAFRSGACGFLDIQDIVESVMEQTKVEPVASLEQLADVDRHARELAKDVLKTMGR